MKNKLISAALSAAAFSIALGASAEEPSLELLQLEVKRLQQLVDALGQQAPSESTGLRVFNPEIGAVLDIVGAFTESKEDDHGNDKLSVRELELILGAEVDPYTRFDSTIVFSDFEDVHLEEAYVTRHALPFDSKLRLGRVRNRIGITSAQHVDALDTVYHPFVVQNYFGEEGLFRTAAEISTFLPLPWETLSHELVLGIMEGGVGHGGTAFGDTRRRPSYYAHLKNFWEVSPATGFELSGSYLLGSADEDSSYDVNIFGIHSKFVHNFDPIRRIKLQAEAYIQDRDKPALSGDGGHHAHAHRVRLLTREDHDHDGHDDDHHDVLAAHDHDDEHHHDDLDDHHNDHDQHIDLHGDHSDSLLAPELRKNPFGFYALADLRLATQWSTGVRYDYVEPTNRSFGVRSTDQAYTAYLTFHQSEFARWRAEYQHARLTDGMNDDRFFIQGTFAIGVHKHQLQ